jgi:transcriptional regulator with XRE-family HTH domain
MDLIELAENIRKLRQMQGMTVEQLAAKSGFSKGFISRLENFRISPSLNALNKVAAALGVKMGDLFHDELQNTPFTFGSLGEGEELTRDDNIKYGIKYLALAHSQIGRKLNPFTVEYRPSDTEREFLMHDADEFFVLLEGEIEFYINDEDTCREMSTGDTVYLSANVPHKVKLKSGTAYARALIIYSK